MAIEFDMHQEGDTLYVVVRGEDDDLAEVQRYGMAVIDRCRQGDIRKVLADERQLRYRLGTVDTYELAKYYSQQAPGLGRAAVVCDPGQLDDAQFWETAVSNRGLRVRVFTDCEEAAAWLDA